MKPEDGINCPSGMPHSFHLRFPHISAFICAYYAEFIACYYLLSELICFSRRYRIMPEPSTIETQKQEIIRTVKLATQHNIEEVEASDLARDEKTNY